MSQPVRVVLAMTLAALSAVALTASCESFESEAPAGRDASVDDAGPGPGADSGDAGTSEGGGGREPGFVCGDTRCDAGGGEVCCLATNPASCVQLGTCPGAQQNCLAKSDCQGNMRCCQFAEGAPTTQCLVDCSFAVACENDDECEGSHCMAPTNDAPLWHCGPATTE